MLYIELEQVIYIITTNEHTSGVISLMFDLIFIVLVDWKCASFQTQHFVSQKLIIIVKWASCKIKWISISPP